MCLPILWLFFFLMDTGNEYPTIPGTMNGSDSRLLKGSNVSSSTSDLSSTEYILWDVLYGVICVPTVVGNTLILVCLSKFRDSKSSLHILIGNLAVSDLIVGAVLLPYCIVVDVLELNSEKYFCLTKASLMVFAIGISCYGLLLVSIDRFSAVCFPFRHSNALSKSKIIIMLAIGWTYVAVFAFLPISGWNFYDQNQPYSCTENKVLTPIYQKVMNGNFVVLLSVNLTLYIIVVRISIRKAREVHAEQNIVHDNCYRKNIKELYRVKTMAMVQGLFAICWFPYVVLAITITFTDNQVLEEIEYWTLIPGMLNSCINWIIYGYRNKELRKLLHKHLKCNLSKMFT